MSRYKYMFNLQKKTKNEGVLVPFITVGDPSFNFFLKIIDVLIKNGADALELGIPFSDPMADGPVVQQANLRAFKAGINIETCFSLLSKIRKKYPKIPIGILVYANIVYKYKISNFYTQCSHVGIDSILIPDVPIEESLPFYKESIKKNISQIFICPPNANISFLKKISLYAKGYIYMVSRPGVTGIEKKSYTIDNNIINTLKKYTSVPILQGFGIHKKKEIKDSIEMGTSGIICGSVLIKIIEKYSEEKKILKKIKKKIKFLKLSTKNIF
ncbi:tryptophan synthase subunit alpha [Buchnera aphidicola (Mindarus keteleerifoliae)]|uniref:tryptophan synthase subunit alpha n=1 Tax=Buchnera aphidicola TaxID=9 RepID=UPI0031B674E5